MAEGGNEALSQSSSLGEEDIVKLVANAVPKSTAKSTNWGVKMFQVWAAKIGSYSSVLLLRLPGEKLI